MSGSHPSSACYPSGSYRRSSSYPQARDHCHSAAPTHHPRDGTGGAASPINAQEPPPPLQGQLYMRSRRRPVYQERTVLLHDGTLAYVTAQGETNWVLLSEVAQVSLDSKTRFEFSVHVWPRAPRRSFGHPSAGRAYRFRAMDSATLDSWLQALQMHLLHEREAHLPLQQTIHISRCLTRNTCGNVEVAQQHSWPLGPNGRGPGPGAEGPS